MRQSINTLDTYNYCITSKHTDHTNHTIWIQFDFIVRGNVAFTSIVPKHLTWIHLYEVGIVCQLNRIRSKSKKTEVKCAWYFGTNLFFFFRSSECSMYVGRDVEAFKENDAKCSCPKWLNVPVECVSATDECHAIGQCPEWMAAKKKEPEFMTGKFINSKIERWKRKKKTPKRRFY